VARSTASGRCAVARIFQREIAEGRYLKPVPRTEQVLFKTIPPPGCKHTRSLFVRIPAILNEYRNCLSHMYKLAIDRGELVRNPASKIQCYK
jgi:hypothetical protein